MFHHLFAAAAEEMGASLMRSAFSANIKERRDFSCALFDGEGRMIAQAAHLPVHLGSAPLSLRAARETIDMRPGDVVLLNDPYQGGTHLPDVTLVTPVFLPGAPRPEFYCVNRAHHADIGGAFPGSMAPAPDVHGEGLRIPPVRWLRDGRIDRDVHRMILANVRVTAEREGDLLAQLAASRVGERRLAAMIGEYGAREVRERGAQLMDWTEALMREALGRLPSGTIRARDVLESAGEGIPTLRLALEVGAGRARFDFRSCDPQGPAPVNTVRAVTLSAVFYVLRLLLPPGTPTNDGVLRPVEVLTRPGTLVDARYPAPVAAGNVETSQRLVDLCLAALAPLAPERIPAASAGTMSNLTFGTGEPTEPSRGSSTAAAEEAFAYYETIAGGAGAGPGGPGAHAVQTHMTNTRNTPIEALEMALPVRVLACTVRRDSGGRGRHAGGDGVRKRLRFLRSVHVGWIAERQTRGPAGLAGGGAGEPGSARVRRPGARGDARLPSRAGIRLEAGSELEVRTPGGGGFGRG